MPVTITAAWGAWISKSVHGLAASFRGLPTGGPFFGEVCYTAVMFEKDPKSGMLKPVWEKPRRSRTVKDVASTKTADDIDALRTRRPSERGIAFEAASGWWWAALDQEVRFTVRNDGTTILCRLPQAWLEARYGCGRAPEALLAAARKDFDPLTDLAEAWIAAGRFEKDGSVVFRTD